MDSNSVNDAIEALETLVGDMPSPAYKAAYLQQVLVHLAATYPEALTYIKSMITIRQGIRHGPRDLEER